MSRLLLDTQILIWLATSPSLVPTRCLSAIRNPEAELHVSVVSFWEVSIKLRLNRLSLGELKLQQFIEKSAMSNVRVVGVIPEDTIALEQLPLNEHRDPFDRMIAVQSLQRGLTLVSVDDAFDQYGVDRIW